MKPFNKNFYSSLLPVPSNLCFYECDNSKYLVSEIIEYLFFCNWLISLTVSSQFIILQYMSEFPYFLKLSIALYGHITLHLFICPLWLLPPLTMLNNAFMNRVVQISCCVPHFMTQDAFEGICVLKVRLIEKKSCIFCECPFIYLKAFSNSGSYLIGLDEQISSREIVFLEAEWFFFV